ncbi:MAG: hypothetical protein RL418_679, partial [Actinomycetota bacterium]
GESLQADAHLHATKLSEVLWSFINGWGGHFVCTFDRDDCCDAANNSKSHKNNG